MVIPIILYVHSLRQQVHTFVYGLCLKETQKTTHICLDHKNGAHVYGIMIESCTLTLKSQENTNERIYECP